MTTKTQVNRRTFLRRTGIAGAGLGGGWITNGCGLRKAALPSRTFLLKGPGSPAAGERSGDPAPRGVLLVRPFKVATAFDSRAFVVRRSDSEYVTDVYHAFLVPPGSMLTDLAAVWARSLGVFATVTTGGSQLAPTHALEGEVTECYADYRDAKAPKAVIAGQFRLLHPLMGGASPVLWQVQGGAAVVIPRAGPDALVAGWEQGIAEWFAGLERMLRQRGPSAGGSNV